MNDTQSKIDCLKTIVAKVNFKKLIDSFFFNFFVFFLLLFQFGLAKMLLEKLNLGETVESVIALLFLLLLYFAHNYWIAFFASFLILCVGILVLCLGILDFAS